jgi:hypothetical protein
MDYISVSARAAPGFAKLLELLRDYWRAVGPSGERDRAGICLVCGVIGLSRKSHVRKPSPL